MPRGGAAPVPQYFNPLIRGRTWKKDKLQERSSSPCLHTRLALPSLPFSLHFREAPWRLCFHPVCISYKGGLQESCHGTSLQITGVGRCFLIKEIQVMKKMSWVESGNVPATNPNAQHLLLDSVKCHCQEREGGGADVGSRMLPALGSLPCGVQGQCLKDLRPWWTQSFLMQWRVYFFLDRSCVELCRTLGPLDPLFFGGKRQQGNDVPRTEK